jgi:hypothetical protein
MKRAAISVAGNATAVSANKTNTPKYGCSVIT